MPRSTRAPCNPPPTVGELLGATCLGCRHVNTNHTLDGVCDTCDIIETILERDQPLA